MTVDLFIFFDINSRVRETDIGIDAWQMPAYHIADFSTRYKFKIGKLNASIYGKINNILNTDYIADATDGENHDYETSPVYYGFGRTYTFGAKIKF